MELLYFFSDIWLWSLKQESLLEADTCTIESRHRNIIAVGLDIVLLKNVVKTAANAEAEHVEVKLVNRDVSLGAGAHRQHPFLVFTIKVPSSRLIKLFGSQ